jgi:hypothetical protein
LVATVFTYCPKDFGMSGYIEIKRKPSLQRIWGLAIRENPPEGDTQ